MHLKIVLFPLNGNALEALDCLSALGREHEIVGFVDDDPKKIGTKVNGKYPVHGREFLARLPAGTEVLAVPGSPATYLKRDELIRSLGVPRDKFATVIHPDARISPSAELGRNVLVMGGVTVSHSARLGDHICVLPNTVIHHHSVIGDFTLIGSNVTVAGRCTIGSKCYLGAGSAIINDAKIGAGALVGLGAAVVRDVAAEARVAGNPARELKRKRAAPAKRKKSRK